MTVQNTASRVDTYGNGVSTAFAVPFYFLDSAHLKVLLTNLATGAVSTPVLNSDYTVTGAGVSSGGTVTFSAAPATGYKVSILRNVPNTQLTHYVEGDPFPAASHETALDKLTMEVQQLAEETRRALALPPNTTGVSAELPTPLPNQLVAWNETATQLQGVDTATFNTMVIDAVASTLQQLTNDRISVRDPRFGAKGDGVTNDTAAIQAAIDYASATGKYVHVPAGVYELIPATLINDEDTSYPTYACFRMQSNMHILAEPGAIFRIAPGVSTDAAPMSMAMFATDEVLHDVSIRNLVMDMNGANNPISPNRGSLSYRLYNNGQILVSGTVGGVAAAISDALVEGCQFINTAGVCCVCMAQSNSAGGTLGKRWILRGNYFYNNGLDTMGHSSVFAWADDVICEDNTFENPNPSSIAGLTGGRTAYEVHGANQRFSRNKVKNYFRGMWVSSNYTRDCEDIIISDNVFSPVQCYGIDTFREMSGSGTVMTGIAKVTISGNTFGLDDWTSTNYPNKKAAVRIACSYPVSSFLITNNNAAKVGTNIGSAFFVLQPESVSSWTTGKVYAVNAKVMQGGQNYICLVAHTSGVFATDLGAGNWQVYTHALPDKITVRGNHTYGFSMGAYLRTTDAFGLAAVVVQDNDFCDCTPAGVFADSAGVYLTADITTRYVNSLSVVGNNVTDGRASPVCQYGVYLYGYVTTLFVDGNNYHGLIAANYAETHLTVTNRRGVYSSVVFAPGTQPWKNASTPVTLGNGTAIHRYSLVGDVVTAWSTLTLGSTTTLASGALGYTLPFASANTGFRYMGHWRIFDSSASVFYAGQFEADGTSPDGILLLAAPGTGANFVTNQAPVVLAAGDVVSVQITYLKAV